MNLKNSQPLKPFLLGIVLLSMAPLTMAQLTSKISTEPSKKQLKQTRNSFFELYAENRTKNRPNYITADFWLLSYSMIRNSRLAEVEQKQIQPLFSDLLIDLGKAIPAETKDPAQLANQDYLSILMALIDGNYQLSSERAKKELALIIAAKGISVSPLWGMKIDYSQFKPRGRYTEALEQQRYFQAMRYAGSVLFAVKASAATGINEAMADRMTQQAMLLSKTMQNNKKADALENLLAWQMGMADDLTTDDLSKVGNKANIKEQQQALFDYAKTHQKQPKIISGIVDVNKLEKDTTATDVLTGWRLMPLRYSTDNAVFQTLLYPNTGKYTTDCKKCPLPFGASTINGQIVKGNPSAKELMALLNSTVAQNWIKNQHENSFENYADANKQAKKIIAQAKGLNASHLQLLKNWLTAANLTEQQATEHLNSSLGFWTWQRYLSLLYTKQSYSLTGKSLSIPQARPGALLEKATSLYKNLADIVKQHQIQTPHPIWDDFANTLAEAIKISEKKEVKLIPEEEAFLNGLDKTMLSYTSGVTDKPIVVDVHTNPGDGLIVEEGVGLANIVKEQAAWGARFSHHEFKQPLSNRLDNAGWLKKLQEKQ